MSQAMEMRGLMAASPGRGERAERRRWYCETARGSTNQFGVGGCRPLGGPSAVEFIVPDHRRDRDMLVRPRQTARLPQPHGPVASPDRVSCESEFTREKSYPSIHLA